MQADVSRCLKCSSTRLARSVRPLFFADLSIAECYGAKGVKDTYRQVMRSWGKNLDFMCEWVVCLNQKIWQHHDTNNYILAKVYDELWRKADDYCRNHFKGEELSKYYAYID